MTARIIHITLIILLFISTSGFIVKDHFCKSENKHYTSALNSDQGCKSKVCSEASCCNSGEKDNEENNCCDTSNKVVNLDIPQDIIIPEIKEVEIKLLPALNEIAFWDLFSKSHPILHRIYDPPIVIFDISVLYQVFLC